MTFPNPVPFVDVPNRTTPVRAGWYNGAQAAILAAAPSAPATLLRLRAPDASIWDLSIASDGAPVTTPMPAGTVGADDDLTLLAPDGTAWVITVASDGVLTCAQPGA